MRIGKNLIRKFQTILKKAFIFESAFGKIFDFNFDIVCDFSKKFHDPLFLKII